MKVAMLCNLATKFRLLSSSNTLPLRHISFSTPKLSAESKKELPLESILEDFKEPELTEEDIMKIRFKSRLPERIYKAFMEKKPVSLDSKVDFNIRNLRKYYARFGKESKLNPGICWPTKKELLDIVEDDKTFEPPLQDRINRVESARLAEETRKQQVEAEVDMNMANSEKWIQEYHDKIKKKNDKALEMRMEREKLVEEISEYLGYDIDPKDPRFKEAVEQRTREKKKALKVKKQQESYDRMLEKLKKIAEAK